MHMISRPTRATATTSVRRMTGGNSPLLSGTGAPSRSRMSCRSADLAGWAFAAEGLEDEGLPGDGLVGEAVAGLVGMTLTMVSPARSGNDTAQVTSRTGLRA